MKRYHKPAASIALLVSAALWVVVALLPLTEVSPGLEQLDRVESLSKDLRRIASWNMLAALATGIATLLQVADIYAGGMAGTGHSQI
jgi:hypothetical protein